MLNTLLLTGCGTYMARGGSMDWRDDRYYRSTRTNAQLLTGYDMGYGRILTGGCWVTVVCPILMIVSLPLDATLDTVLLPYDAFQPERPKRDMHVRSRPVPEEDLPALPLGAQVQDPTANTPPITPHPD